MLNKLTGHVLLVEDDNLNQVVIKGLLNYIGCTVSLAKAGQEAFDMLTAANAEYEAVIMDIGLPDISGLEVTQKLRESSCKLQHVPVIALTGHIMERNKQICLDKGMTSYMSKPTTIDDLYNELKKFLH